MDFGIVELVIPEEVVPHTIFAEIGHRVRLKVNFTSITNVARSDYVCTIQLWETNNPKKDSL